MSLESRTVERGEVKGWACIRYSLKNLHHGVKLFILYIHIFILSLTYSMLCWKVTLTIWYPKKTCSKLHMLLGITLSGLNMVSSDCVIKIRAKINTQWLIWLNLNVFWPIWTDNTVDFHWSFEWELRQDCKWCLGHTVTVLCFKTCWLQFIIVICNYN